MSKFSIVLVFISTFISCGNKKDIPAGLLKQDKMQAVLWDVIRADALTSEFAKHDPSKNTAEENAKLQREIFALHKVSREDFYNSLGYYKANMDKMNVILDSMINKANRERNTNMNIYPAIKVEK